MTLPPIALALVFLTAAPTTRPAPSGPPDPPPGRGPQDPALRSDQDVFHALLRRHNDIRREVIEIPGGVETLTESDDPEVAGWIREHVHAMKARVEQRRPLRRWDPLFRAIFQHAHLIDMQVQDTPGGVRVRETSTNEHVTLLIRAHAKAVSGFVERGFDAAKHAHPVPIPPTPPTPQPPQPSTGG